MASLSSRNWNSEIKIHVTTILHFTVDVKRIVKYSVLESSRRESKYAPFEDASSGWENAVFIATVVIGLIAVD